MMTYISMKDLCEKKPGTIFSFFYASQCPQVLTNVKKFENGDVRGFTYKALIGDAFAYTDVDFSMYSDAEASRTNKSINLPDGEALSKVRETIDSALSQEEVVIKKDYYERLKRQATLINNFFHYTRDDHSNEDRERYLRGESIETRMFSIKGILDNYVKRVTKTQKILPIIGINKNKKKEK